MSKTDELAEVKQELAEQQQTTAALGARLAQVEQALATHAQSWADLLSYRDVYDHLFTREQARRQKAWELATRDQRAIEESRRHDALAATVRRPKDGLPLREDGSEVWVSAGNSVHIRTPPAAERAENAVYYRQGRLREAQLRQDPAQIKAAEQALDQATAAWHQALSDAERASDPQRWAFLQSLNAQQPVAARAEAEQPATAGVS